MFGEKKAHMKRHFFILRERNMRVFSFKVTQIFLLLVFLFLPTVQA